jgi:4-amino-4-deoxy-L-arabinose transferase-like glycosyltransferase
VESLDPTPRVSPLAILRADIRIVSLVAALSLLLPLLHLITLAELPTFSVPIIDSIEYIDLAHQLLGDAPLDGTPFLHSPLYAAVLALVFKSGGGLLAVRILQAFLNAATCLLLYLVAERGFSRPVARIAAFLWAGYGPIIFFAAEILSVPWVLFLNLAALQLVIVAMDRRSVGAWLAAGAVTGLAATARADILLFVLLLAAMLTWRREASVASRLVYRALPFGAGVVAPLLVVGLLNVSRSGRFLPLPVNSGLNFYIGNNPDYRTTMGIRPGHAFDELARMPLRDGIGRVPYAPEHSRYFYARGLAFVRADPAGFLACLAYKTRALLASYELPETLDLYTTARHGGILRALVWRVGSFSFPFAVLLPLAAFGCWAARDQLRRAPVLSVMLAAYVASLLIYWPSARYRMSLVPLLIIPAAAGISALWHQRANVFRRENARGWAMAFAAFVMAVLPLPHFSQHFNFEAEMHYLAGRELIDRGLPERGAQLIREALQIEPDNVPAHNSLGVYHARRREFVEAADHFRAALRLQPDDTLARTNLARVLEDAATRR